MRATLEHVEWLTDRIAAFYFKPEVVMSFEPGQYIEVTVPHKPVDNRGATRWMSILTTPSEKLIGITTEFPARPSSYKRALRAMRPGEVVELGSILGDFILPKSTEIPLAFVVGGIGVVPVRSMVAHLQEKREHREVRLLYSASSPEELIYHEVFSSYPMEYTPIISRPNASWHGKTGRLTCDTIIDWVGADSNDTLIYLSGPQSLIEPLYNDLLRAGLPRYRLVLDYFPGY